MHCPFATNSLKKLLCWMYGLDLLKTGSRYLTPRLLTLDLSHPSSPSVISVTFCRFIPEKVRVQSLNAFWHSIYIRTVKFSYSLDLVQKRFPGLTKEISCTLSRNESRGFTTLFFQIKTPKLSKNAQKFFCWAEKLFSV